MPEILNIILNISVCHSVKVSLRRKLLRESYEKDLYSVSRIMRKRALGLSNFLQMTKNAVIKNNSAKISVKSHIWFQRSQSIKTEYCV